MNDVAAIAADRESLPRNWCMATIGDLAEYVSRGRAPSYVDESATPVINQRCIRWHGIELDYIKYTDDTKVKSLANEQFLRSGDVLWNSTGTGTIGRATVFHPTARFSRAVVDTHVTIVRSKAYVPELLRYWIASATVQNQIGEMQLGSTNQVELSRERVLNTVVPVPPRAEQERIVAKIDELFSELDAGVASLNRARALLKKYRQAVLKAAVTGELTRDWRERNLESCSGAIDLDETWELRRSAAKSARRDVPEPRSLDPAYLWDVPESWAWCSVDEAGDVQLGQQRAPQHHKGQHMRPYLRVANVLEDELDLSDLKSMNFEPGELSKFELVPGDILLNEGQAPDLIGRSAIYNGEVDGCCIQKTLLRFRTYEGVSSRFAQIVFRYYMHSGRFRKNSRITTNIGHLTRVRFVAMEFPFPATREQEEIANRFEAIDTNIKHLEALLATRFDTPLRQSILKAAFAGKLVPQDPSDEPASVLLERIRAERAARPKPARGRRRKAAAGGQPELLR